MNAGCSDRANQLCRCLVAFLDTRVPTIDRDTILGWKIQTRSVVVYTYHSLILLNAACIQIYVVEHGIDCMNRLLRLKSLPRELWQDLSYYS